ncbi:Alcohol dehydrogenase 2 [Glycine max]|nr:Alcohol dehydrogenase 2 [Glycine max]
MCDLLRINTDRGVTLNDGKLSCVAKINPAAPLYKVCVLSCGISTGLGATLNAAKPTKGSSVVVFGLGAAGLAAAEGARLAVASRIIGGWGVAVPNKDDAIKTHLVNLLNEKTLKGTFFGNYKPRSGIPSVVEMYMNKEIELEKFITHEVPFEEINKAFEYIVKGESLRCIIRMSEWNLFKQLL